MKYSIFTLMLAAATLTGSAALAAGGLHKHDASIASHAYNIPIIDSSSSLNRPGTSLRDDIEKGYKPAANPTPFVQPAPRQATPQQQIAPQAQHTAPAQSGSAFSNVAQGVNQETNAAPAVTPAEQAPAAQTSAQEPVTLSTPDAPAAPQAATTPAATNPTRDATKPSAPESALPQTGITITGENADGIPPVAPAAQ